MDLVFNWPQVVLLLLYIITFGAACVHSQKPEDYIGISLRITLIMFLLYKGGFFSGS